jgi:hypothetical protein
MANSTYTEGDTWPPQRFKAEDADGLVDLSTADEIEALIRGKKGSVLISGTAVAIQPPDEDGYNGKYVWATGDLDEVADDYDVEIKVTWDKESSPKKIQTFPNKTPRPTLEVVESNAS